MDVIKNSSDLPPLRSTNKTNFDNLQRKQLLKQKRIILASEEDLENRKKSVGNKYDFSKVVEIEIYIKSTVHLFMIF